MFCVQNSPAPKNTKTGFVPVAQKNCEEKCKQFGGFGELSYEIGFGGNIPNSFTQECLNKHEVSCACAK